ncbi:hypothetical protein D3C76_948520 [compost metagenome]
MVNERLFGMQDATQVKTDQIQEGAQVATFAFQALEKRRWHREAFVAGGHGGFFVGVDRVGFTDGLGKKTQAPFLDIDIECPELVPDQTLVCHSVHSSYCF